MFRMALLMAAAYLLGLSFLAFAFILVAGEFLSKTSYISMGVIGTIFIIVSLGYVFRKNYLKKLSRMKVWLDLHVLTGTIGAFLIMVHSEFHLRALVPSVALIFMLMVVVSGIVGQYLIAKITKQIAKEKAQQKVQPSEDDLMVLVFSVSIMKHWRKVHLHMTPIPIIMTVLHVISEFYYRGLRF